MLLVWFTQHGSSRSGGSLLLPSGLKWVSACAVLFLSSFFFWCYICGNDLFVHYFGETVLDLHVASLVSKLLCLWKSQECGWLKDQNGKQMYTKIMVGVKHGVNGIAVEGYFAEFFFFSFTFCFFFFFFFFWQKKCMYQI